MSTSNRKSIELVHAACENDEDEVRRLMMDPEVDVNVMVGIIGEPTTALSRLVFHGRVEFVRFLLFERNADPNRGSISPLRNACNRNSLEAVKLLLSHPRIDVNPITRTGMTLFDVGGWTCEDVEKRLEIVSLILKSGTRPPSEKHECVWWGEKCRVGKFIEKTKIMTTLTSANTIDRLGTLSVLKTFPIDLTRSIADFLF